MYKLEVAFVLLIMLADAWQSRGLASGMSQM